MFVRFFKPVAAALIAASIAAVGQADDVSVPEGDVVLTVSGVPGMAHMGDVLQFDRESLAELGVVTVETSTIWTDGIQVFEGVPLVNLTTMLDLEDGTLRATAINDYAIEIPVEDAVEGGPIIAMLMNGEEMSIRDKGPLWVIYPYDSSPDYRTEVVYSRSIWQLDRIEFIE